MPADNVSGFKAATIRYLKELGIEIARWPGGNFVSAYDWRDGIGDRDSRPPRRELAWNGMESNDMGIDDFMTFCRLIGAEPYLAVNSGLGDAHSAAEEVEYVNGPATSRLGKLRAANGHAAPVRREDLGRRQRDVRPVAVGPHVDHAVPGQTQPDGQGDAEGRPDDQGHRLRRHARRGVVVLHREPAVQHVRRPPERRPAAAVRLRVARGLDGSAAQDVRRPHRLPR